MVIPNFVECRPFMDEVQALVDLITNLERKHSLSVFFDS